MTTLNVPPLGHPCPSCAGTLYGHFPLDGMEAGDNVPCPTCREPNLKHARMNGLYICPECNYTDCMPVLGHNRHPQPDPTSDVLTDPYYEAIRELRDRLAWHQDTLDTLRHRIEEHAEQAAALEDQCYPIEATIASIRALIALAGGTA